MTDDEEKQLKQALLAVKLSLRRKQEFWETPRNIAILVGVTAAIAAALGFWFGHESAAPNFVRPAGLGSLGEMRPDQFVDAVQTAGIIVIAAMLVYVVVRLDRTLTASAEKLKVALATQHALQEGVERVWARLDLFIPAAELKAMLDAIQSRLDRLEAVDEDSPDDH